MMPYLRKQAAAITLGVVIAAGSAAAQQDAGPPAVKPGPEHKRFERLVGTWDATTTMHGMPSSKGVETSRLMGGLWLVSEFKSEMAGAPFEGHAMYGYDPDKKKYVGVWVDTQSTSFQLSEGTLSADGNTLTMTGEMKNPMGAGMVTITFVDTFTDANTRMFAMKMPMPGGGGEVDMMTIAYKRRK